MKPVLVALFPFLLATNVFGQIDNPEFTAVAKKFEKGNFESALESAESLIDNDKHRKKPEPYLWASMCYYAIHNSDLEKLQERFSAPLKNALKYAGKAVQKDKDNTIVENNLEYFETMKREGVAFAKEYEASDDHRKALYTYKQILNFVPNDPYVLFAKGVSELRQSATYDAEKDIAESFPVLDQRYRDIDYVPDPATSPLLKDAVVYYIDHLILNAYVDSARTVAMTARVFFPLDEGIKATLEGIK